MTLQPMALENPDWAAEGLALIERMAAEGRRFSTDDLHEVIGEPRHPNQWGRLMRRAATLGYVEADGFMLSRRRSRHGAVIRVWAPNPETYAPGRAA